MSRKHQVRKRDMSFAKRTMTKIWQETPSERNPYLAEECRCHGYDILELAQKRSFIEVLFLLFQGELPSAAQAELLETLMVCLINPGPRHPATRAAMNAGVGKTIPSHILPIGLNALGSEYLGGQEVEAGIRFFRKYCRDSPDDLVAECLKEERPHEGDWHIVPGFGSRFGEIDPMPLKIISQICTQGSGQAISWGCRFAEALKPYGMGWLTTGVAAAVLSDLGFLPQAGSGLFQLICAPGILAHGLELANKPISAMPFLDEEHYVVEPESRKK